MSAQSLFSKKNIEQQQTDTRRGLMEELNLPPKMVSFVRKNARNLQIGLASIVVLVLAWVFFDYYTELQEKKGASLLASGLQAEKSEQRTQLLGNVIKDYGRTDAARWASLELAHIDYKEGRFAEAAEKYQEILESLPAGNPLVPLVRLNLAQSYEQADQYDQAIAQYKLLQNAEGYTTQAYWGLGRMYMAKDDQVQARTAYGELLNSLEEDPDPVVRSQVEAKLASLDAGKPAVSVPLEENKE